MNINMFNADPSAKAEEKLTTQLSQVLDQCANGLMSCIKKEKALTTIGGLFAKNTATAEKNHTPSYLAQPVW